MSQHIIVDGTPFTDEDVERWAAEDESEEGYSGGHLGPAVEGLPVIGRPVTVGEGVRPFTVRLDASRRLKLEAMARAEGVSVSEVVRTLIDAHDFSRD